METNVVEMGRPVRLRWWQRLAIYRQLEHRADGTLCWKTIVESCPRRAGKSARIRAVAMCRISHPEPVGQTQTVTPVANNLAICREIHRPARLWVDPTLKDTGWRTANNGGNEEMVSPTYDRLVVRSLAGVYGLTTPSASPMSAGTSSRRTLTRGWSSL